MKYEKNKNVSLISAPIPTKYLPGGTKILCSLIDTSINESEFSGAWNIVALHCANGGFHIQGIDFDQSYSPVLYSDPFIINIVIMDMHRLTSSILYISNDLQNKNEPIHERSYVIPPPYYID